MYPFETDDDIIKLIESCEDEKTCVELLSFVQNRCAKDNIQIDGFRWKSIVSHMAAMVRRSVLNEKLEEVDKDVFAEISQDMVDIADEVVQKLPNLSESEKYLLAVHFEVAKQNS